MKINVVQEHVKKGELTHTFFPPLFFFGGGGGGLKIAQYNVIALTASPVNLNLSLPFHQADPGGMRCLGGQNYKLHKEGKNVASMRTNLPHFAAF